MSAFSFIADAAAAVTDAAAAVTSTAEAADSSESAPLLESSQASADGAPSGTPPPDDRGTAGEGDAADDNATTRASGAVHGDADADGLTRVGAGFEFSFDERALCFRIAPCASNSARTGPDAAHERRLCNARQRGVRQPLRCPIKMHRRSSCGKVALSPTRF